MDCVLERWIQLLSVILLQPNVIFIAYSKSSCGSWEIALWRKKMWSLRMSFGTHHSNENKKKNYRTVIILIFKFDLYVFHKDKNERKRSQIVIHQTQICPLNDKNFIDIGYIVVTLLSFPFDWNSIFCVVFFKPSSFQELTIIAEDAIFLRAVSNINPALRLRQNTCYLHSHSTK
jgi:hypothetical protein